MLGEKLVVSAEEISRLAHDTDLAAAGAHEGAHEVDRRSTSHWAARAGLSVLVLCLPVLCIVTVAIRLVLRGKPEQLRYAWLSFLSTLLVISSLLTCLSLVVLFSGGIPLAAPVGSSLPELDAKRHFPALPSGLDLSSRDISERLKPLVVVVSPAATLWNRREVPSAAFGAGALLSADKRGYLIATADHVTHSHGWGSTPSSRHAMVSMAAGLWTTAEVVARSPDLDLALLWVARRSGDATFTQPISAAHDGAEIFVIGHPEGLKYTLSTGIISSLRDQTIQISAAVSPGNSGGPVYDRHGNLVGIVSSKFDHNADSNAENLGFAAEAGAFLHSSVWQFPSGGQRLLDSYINAANHVSIADPAPSAPPTPQD